MLNYEYHIAVLSPYKEVIVPYKWIWDATVNELKKNENYIWNHNRPAIIRGRDTIDFSGKHWEFRTEWSRDYYNKLQDGFYPISDWASEFYRNSGVPLEAFSIDKIKFENTIKSSRLYQVVKMHEGTPSSLARGTYVLDSESAKKALFEAGLSRKYPNFNPIYNWKFV